MLAICIVDFSFFRLSVRNVSAVETLNGIEVYWDENCSRKVYSIDWGVISLGDVERVMVYVWNKGNKSFPLAIISANWNPENASRYLRFFWSCQDAIVGVDRVVKVTLSLYVSPYTIGISDFSFDIIFFETILADVNRDGWVDMDDIGLIGLAYGAYPGHPEWNPNYDVNSDDFIDMTDIGIACLHYGETMEP